MPYVNDVLTFWFDELRPEQHFKPSTDVDDAIRERFLTVYETLVDNPDVDAALTSSDRALATLIVLDQFPRNIFRGTARAFAADATALALAKATVRIGYDQKMQTAKRKFVYLPYEHSENIDDQWACVRLMSALDDDELNKYAMAHCVIIERFGRFPHRNKALGRISTPEEIEFLKQPNSSF